MKTKDIAVERDDLIELLGRTGWLCDGKILLVARRGYVLLGTCSEGCGWKEHKKMWRKMHVLSEQKKCFGKIFS